MTQLFTCTLIIVLSLFLGPFAANALQLQSSCITNLSTQQQTNTQPDQKIEMASLSKILLTHWSLSRLGVDFRFSTKIHLIPVENDVYDLHFEGGFDPVFSRDRLQYLIALLNNLGIFKLRQMSFDENFIFLDHISLIASSDSFPHDPKSTRTQTQLTNTLAKLLSFYTQTKARALQYEKIVLPASIQIQHEKISFVSKNNFYRLNATNKHLVELQSIPLKNILFEMNQRSNNHIADFIFQYLGSAKAYSEFAQKELHAHSQSFEIRNGSGHPILKASGAKFYNAASCLMIVSALAEIKKILARSNLDLESLFSMVGVDNDPQMKSPVSTHYSSPLTERSMIAKTGSIDPAIGLAGILLTQKGDVFFSILYQTAGQPEWALARAQILQEITELLQKNGAKPRVLAPSKSFLSFDNKSLKKN